MTRRIFISPHMDDIAFSAFQSIYDSNKQDDSHIVLVFSKSRFCYFDPDTNTSLAALKDKIPADELEQKITMMRTAEEKQFAKSMGATLTILTDDNNTPFGDSSTRREDFLESDYNPSQEIPEGNLRSSLTKSMQTHLLANADNASKIYIPLGNSKHNDHIVVRDIAREIIRCFGWAQENILFYEDLPYANTMSLDELDAYANSVNANLSPKELELMWQEKRRAITGYASQIGEDTIENIEEHARRLSTEGKAIERVWSL